jgi:hypothetical protein
MRITPGELRLGASAAITALSGVIAYYPTQHWIPAVIAAGAVLGIHVIPAVTQSNTEELVPQIAPAVIPERIVPMSEDAAPEETGTVESMTGYNGSTLMGLTPPVSAPETAAETPAEVAGTETPPVVESTPAATPDVAGQVRTAAQNLAAVANQLLEVAKNLS